MLGAMVTVMSQSKNGALSGMVRRLMIALAIAASVSPLTGRAQENDPTQPEVLQVRSNFYMIAGAGSNIGVQIGDDGIVLVNTGAAATNGEVSRAIRGLTSKGVTYIINSSDDADDVGGNATIPQAVNPSGWAEPVIVATQSVLDRMVSANLPSASLPTDTLYLQEEKPLYLNGEGIEVLARHAAHTDGDAMVFFRRSDVLMAGNALDTTRFPVIDLKRGGGIQGEIDALNDIITIAIPAIPFVFEPGGTYVIPSHGHICEQDDIVQYRNMITIIRDVVQDMINRGMSLRQVEAANPTEGYRERYGSDSGSWTTEMFVEAVYNSLKMHPASADLARDVGNE